jgi:hypothetical protein
MKALKLYIAMLLAAVLCYACNPIEDTSLREKYYDNAGTPITKTELNAAISVTQPIPNMDGVVAGDQYVVLNYKRPDVPGVWHYQTSTGYKTVLSDHDTILYDANGSYKIYFTALSARTMVVSDTITVSVTNCFDEYIHFLTGAQDKADKTAKKKWKFVNKSMANYNGMLDTWQYFTMTPGVQAWGGSVLSADDFNKKMEFDVQNSKLIVYSSAGAIDRQGNWAANHNTDQKTQGQLACSVQVLTGNSGGGIWQAFSGVKTPYYILKISETELILALPTTYSPPDDWYDFDASYYFFVPADN